MKMIRKITDIIFNVLCMFTVEIHKPLGQLNVLLSRLYAFIQRPTMNLQTNCLEALYIVESAFQHNKEVTAELSCQMHFRRKQIQLRIHIQIQKQIQIQIKKQILMQIQLQIQIQIRIISHVKCISR